MKKLFEYVILEDSSQSETEEREIAFVVKEAYGRSESITAIRSELIEFNFDIHERYIRKIKRLKIELI